MDLNNNRVNLIWVLDTNTVQFSRRTDRYEADFLSQLKRSNSAGVKSLVVYLEKLKRGGRGSEGRDTEKQEEYPVCRSRVYLVLSVREHNKQGLLILISISPPPLFNFYRHIDIDEALTFFQLQKSNRAGVKSYGLVPNNKILIIKNSNITLSKWLDTLKTSSLSQDKLWGGWLEFF